VNNLKGDLLIYFGTEDNNVHPSNALQLIKALQGAGKHFDVLISPDQAHSEMSFERTLEFLIESLVIRPASRLR
jgi:dipeptidyl-peptidase 4